MAARYRRTPLPPDARLPTAWLVLWLTLLIASPGIGFALHGRIDVHGLVKALTLMLLPLLALAGLAWRRWRALRGLPAALREEWRTGRLVPAEGAPEVPVPARYASGQDWMEFRPEGLTVASRSVLGLQGVAARAPTPWAMQQAGQLFLSWTEIVEWIVDTDSDGPDLHRLRLHGAGELRLRRFRPTSVSECDLLDAVRSVGRLPIRLRSDVDCA